MIQREKHLLALHNFIEQVKDDSNVIALLLSGSLSYGTVWEKSDIDLTMIVRDGSISQSMEYCVDEIGIEIHVYLMEVSKFKNKMQKLRGGEYPHSYFGKGTMVFSKDESLNEFFEDASRVGTDDAVMSFICMIENLLVEMNRAEKWITVFGDMLYAQRFLQRCCTIVADMVLLLHAEEPTRESVLRAMELDPVLMRAIYIIPSTTTMTEVDIRHTLQVLDDFLMKHIQTWSKPIIKYLSDDDVKKVSECNKHFDSENLTVPLACLASKGIIQRVTQPSRIFKHSKLTVEEIAYFYIKEENENV
ncbi:MAG: hypothetical protein A2Y17_05600 [Clostridiales bacterium GWF2_38_85]|nr:MAG: hypothetical protein A2Y17_05600 [Clostridiales bacterium GWF2_38_85]HBL84044.1 nucleotidyltransferase [Clostridiales bacterium]